MAKRTQFWAWILGITVLAFGVRGASAQYMYLDANGDGVHTTADRLNANGTPTPVRVYLNTNTNRDGSQATCNTGDSPILNAFSYIVTLHAVSGTVTYSGFANQQASMTVHFGELNSGNGDYKNGYGGPLPGVVGGPHLLASLTITGTGGSPSIEIVDQIAGSPDFTSFGSSCTGTGFDNTYRLDGPNTQALYNGPGDWFDADGLSAIVDNAPPVLNAIGNKTTQEGSTLTFTATASDFTGSTLTFTLDPGAPAGATINGATGVFTWTPTEAQGPGTFLTTVRVTRSSDSASDVETIQVTVQEVNIAPILAPIGNKAQCGVGFPITFTAVATDADLPANNLTFSLGAGAPAGATIGASSGVFSWTPPTMGTFPVTVIVTDNGTPPLNDSESILITIGGCGSPPVLATIGNKTVNEGSCLTFTATATDTDPGQTITFSLGSGAPAGASISPGGSFTWCPSEAQGPGTYSVTVCATDNGSPPLQDCETIVVTVNEVNLAPVLAQIGNKIGSVGTAITFTATATDADIPANTLAFSLGAGAPAGATINATSGAFSWTPSSTQGGQTHLVTVLVADNGAPPLGDSETISIQVGPDVCSAILAAIGNKTVAEGSLLSFTATATDPQPGQSRTFSLDAPAPAGASITATGAFTWTPTEAQGPGSFPITVRVTYDNPFCTDSETITVTVTEVNAAPILAAIGNQTVNELVPLSFAATATDADLPANVQTFSLGAGAPPGSAITPGGSFTWTPAEAQGPGDYPITIIVTDNGTPAMNDSETFQVHVNEVNFAPVLGAIGNKTVFVFTTLTFTATAADPDIPAQTLTFSLTLGSQPATGATINPTTGVFAWTPTESQGGASYPVTISVTDSGAPNLGDSETIAISVIGACAPVVLSPIGNRTVDEGSLLSFTATATDGRGEPITFSLGAGAPAGASIQATTGIFSWTPTEAQGPGVYPITVIATVGTGPCPSSDFETIQVQVNEVHSVPVLTQPSDMTVDEGAVATQQLTAVDPDIPAPTLTFSKVSGPIFVTVSSSGLVTAAPNFFDQGVYPVTVRVSDGALTDDATFQLVVLEEHRVPIAEANGPYVGVTNVAVTFDATGSFDPDGDPISYEWDFGDGVTGVGPAPPHVYAAAGEYTVTLMVCEDTPLNLCGSDATTATIVDFFTTQVFLSGGNKTIRLGSGKSSWCAQVEPVGGVYNVGDVDLTSVRLLFGAGQIPAIADKTVVDGDKDRNGAPEITACFSKADLRTLFAGQPTGDYEVKVAGSLVSGGSFQGSVTVHVVNNGGFVASISPNPLNPRARLTFRTSRVGSLLVELFDIQGRRIRTLVDEPNAPAGHHDVEIDGRDGRGQTLASGIYYVKIHSGVDGEVTQALTILK